MVVGTAVAGAHHCNSKFSAFFFVFKAVEAQMQVPHPQGEQSTRRCRKDALCCPVSRGVLGRGVVPPAQTCNQFVDR